MTTISLDISVTYDRLPPNTPRSTGSYKAWGVSLLVHGAIIVIFLVFGTTHSNSSKTVTPPPQIINAELILPQHRRPLPNKVDPEHQPSISSTVNSPLEDTEVRVAPAITTTPRTPVNLSQDNQIAIEEDDVNTVPNSTTFPQASAKTNTFDTSTQGLQQYFDLQNDFALQHDAERAAQTYQERKTSPVLSDSRAGQPTLNEERPVISANCDSTGNKVLSVLSGFTGGTIQCSDKGDPTQFIEGRINKRPIRLAPQKSDNTEY